jgi:hypothetical protein
MLGDIETRRFESRIKCLFEFEVILYSATCAVAAYSFIKRKTSL